MDEIDKRQHTRVTIDAFVKVVGDDHPYVFRTRDVSQGGLFLYTRVGHVYPFKVGSVVDLELYDYDHFVTAKAVVVRVVRDGTPEAERYPLGFGVRFVDIAPEASALLLSMLERARRGEDPY